MNVLALCLIAALLTLISCKVCDVSVGPVNNRPIIGILAQTYYGYYKHYHRSYAYIASSYVKFVEAGGARPVPILVDQDENYYRNLLNSINGVLLPGGGQYLNDSLYSTAAQIIWKIALEFNDKGDRFPVWGTCLGFEAMMYFQADETSHTVRCSAYDVALPLTFLPGAHTSRMYKNIDKQLRDHLKSASATANYHRNCLTLSNFSKSGLDKHFTPLTTSKDSSGVEFISSIEAIGYPFYGVQFHPEKNAFEWIVNEKHQRIPHNWEAVLVTQYYANFFVNEARGNHHCFKDLLTENNVLIYNYESEFTGYTGVGSCYNMYFFQISSFYAQKLTYLFSAILFLVVVFI